MGFHFKIYIYLTGQQGIFSSKSFVNFPSVFLISLAQPENKKTFSY